MLHWEDPINGLHRIRQSLFISDTISHKRIVALSTTDHNDPRPDCASAHTFDCLIDVFTMRCGKSNSLPLP